MTDDTTRLPSNGKTTHVPVRTPAGDRWDCPVGYLPVALEKGFSRIDADGPPTEPDSDDLFDPTAPGVSVDDVNAYLVSVVDVPGEVDRVLAAEAAGKARTTIVDPRPPVD